MSVAFTLVAEEEKEEDSKASKMVEEVRAAEDGLLVAQELPRQ